MICRICNKNEACVHGMCVTCYKREKIVCKVCGEKAVKLGRCEKHLLEYREEQKKKKEEKKKKYCKICGEEAVKLRLCKKHLEERREQQRLHTNDYRRKYYINNKEKITADNGICTKCGNEGFIVKGLCRKCYYLANRKCSICGGPFYKRHMCKKHYDEYVAKRDVEVEEKKKRYYQVNKDWINEKSKKHHKLNSEVYRNRAREWNKNHRNKKEQ